MTNETRVEKLARQIIETVAKKEELAEYEKNLRSALADEVENGTTPVGDYKITRRDNVRFDAATAKKNLSEDELKQISVSKPDAARAKALLDEDRLTLCQKNYGAIVQVGLRDD